MKMHTQTWEAAGGGARTANPELKKVLEGGTLSLDAIIMCRRMTQLMTMKARQVQDKEILAWSRERGSIVEQVRKDLRENGWKERVAWKWEHEELEKDIDLTRIESLERSEMKECHTS